MNKLFLITSTVIFCSIIAGESRATIQEWNCGEVKNGVYDSNVKCTYDSETSTLVISGNGNMGNYDHVRTGPMINGWYAYKSTAPWKDSSITKVVVGDGVTSIGDNAFMGKIDVQSVSGMKDVTTVGKWAFDHAFALSSIDMPAVTTVDQSAFQGITSLTSVSMPNVQTIAKEAFKDMTNLEYVYMPSNTSIGSHAFDVDPNKNSHYYPLDVWTHCTNDSTTGYKTCGSCGSDMYVQDGTGCVRQCKEGFGAIDGMCVEAEEVKLRYTLPEADAATSDDNENTIEWIFE